MIMNKGIIGRTFEAVKEEGIESVKTATTQITGKQKTAGQTNQGQTKPGYQETPPAQKTEGSIPQTEETKAVVRHLYGGEKPEMPKEEVVEKELEDRQRTEALRQRLHSEYYQTITRPSRQKEERPAEKVEREKRQEMQELEQKEAKKPSPIAAQRGRERVEKFRGVSG